MTRNDEEFNFPHATLSQKSLFNQKSDAVISSMNCRFFFIEDEE